MTVLLRPDTGDDRRYEDLLGARPDGAAASPPWWMPALVHLALGSDDVVPEARAELDGWAARRRDCLYAVVQEETDDHLSLTASSWPLVDPRGRLRFPVGDDPLELDVERGVLQHFVDAHRARWRELGLLGAEQATAPIRLGDAFAITFERPSGAVVRLREAPLRRSSSPAELTLEPAGDGTSRGVAEPDPVGSDPVGSDPVGLDLVEHTRSAASGRRRRRRIASTSGLAVDITWDARQAGKVAQLAAFAGVLAPAPPSGAAAAHAAPADVAGSSGDDERISEGLDRQLRGFAADLTPDETVALADDTDPTDRPPAPR